MATYRLHLAMAALAGASVVAVSTYYMHQKTVIEFLGFINTVGREKYKEVAGSETGLPARPKRRRSNGRRKLKELRRTMSSPPIVDAHEIDHRVGKPKSSDRVEGIPIKNSKLHAFSEVMAMSDFSPE
ncbi:hypothetical protein ACJRO7_008583 [Eucalyptus globulus]|uniref:Uncharacterized protein n=1 Tax=Eucalyptus globulus TaxID=34317 RepID=A0ABD3ISN5_EUCGL